ncbi:MAG: sugar ABC transporter substrate-binding protein [Candidatus Cohnella colombiensis]|uniref:Sugar ABC transporter substrate-binding protein n=1 Tax=Candidatus Cohnella colombiensis TaxID=3121368 RepID=A0AA95EWI5_9BACL|nr:MAG: sugar ABC transporter substrate-binding protein [Cohnella sp.]
MSKKFGFLAIALIMLLTACSTGSNSNKNSESSQSSTATTSEAPAEKVTLTMQDYLQGGNSEAMDALIKAYMDKHPNVTIDRQNVPFADNTKKLMVGIVSKTLPDIALVDGADHLSLAAAGVFADISDLIKQWGEIDQYFDGPMSSTILDGKNYGIPLSNNLLALFYNVDMFEAANLQPPTTWEELKSIAATLSKDGVYGFGASGINSEEGVFQFLPFVWQGGGDVTNINSQGTIDALNLWKGLIDNGNMTKDILTQTQQDVMIQFAAGKTAMMVNGPWQIPNLTKQATFKWATVPLPKGQADGTILGGMNLGISSESKHQDAAWDFLKFTQEAENLKNINVAIGNVAPRKDVVQDDHWQKNALLKPFADSMPFAKARAYGPDYPKMSIAIQEMMQKVFTNHTSADNAVKEAEDIIKPFLK